MNHQNIVDLTTAIAPEERARRHCFLLHVRPEKLAEYVEVHQCVWPEMLDALRRAGWRNYSLFLREADGLIVGYFESDDVAEAQAAMARDAVNAKWQAEMAQYFAPEGIEHLELYFRLP